MHPGELIAGRYEMVARLGRGGMGEVWSARDRSLRRDVAVKLLYLDDADAGDGARRFEREAVAAAQISHPNVAVVHDRGVQDGVLFLVMERIDGTTLSRALGGGVALPVVEAVRIASRICDALVAAHKAGVIHYDIKPHNVMIAVDGTVKVVDFGIAGFVHSQFTVARTSQLAPAGTPEFGAPEQFLEERGDERSDLYALGGVLFCMLTGRPPFQGQNGIAVMLRKRDEVAPRVDELAPNLPPALTELVAGLLERDAERRPQSAAEVAARLAEIDRELAVAAGPAAMPAGPAVSGAIAGPVTPAPPTVSTGPVAPVGFGGTASGSPGGPAAPPASAAPATPIPSQSPSHSMSHSPPPQPSPWVEAGATPRSLAPPSHFPTLSATPPVAPGRQPTVQRRPLAASWPFWCAVACAVGIGAATQLAGVGARVVATEPGTGRQWTDEVWQSTQSWLAWTGDLFTGWSHGAALQIVLLAVFLVAMARLGAGAGEDLRVVGYAAGVVSAVWLTVATLSLAGEDQRESALHLATRVAKFAPPSAGVRWQTYILPGPIVLTVLVWIGLAVYAGFEIRSRARVRRAAARR
ncbi:MAG: serine/threonine protein kinase [Catenulispora sp.]|nr:serine/threonine protein kinase [Catenulispora sp.]